VESGKQRVNFNYITYNFGGKLVKSCCLVIVAFGALFTWQLSPSACLPLSLFLLFSICYILTGAAATEAATATSLPECQTMLPYHSSFVC